VGGKRSPRLMRRPLIGLDVDSSSVKMIRLRRRNEEYTVIGAAVSDVAPWGDDREQHRANTVGAIRACLGTLGPGSKLAVCGLRGPEVVVRGFEFPMLPPEETRGAVELEASQMCPFSMEDGALDQQVTSDHGNKTRGFWVAAERGLIEDRTQLVREAGLQCVLMDVDGLALLNCLENSGAHVPQEAHGDDNDSSDETRSVILDVGDSHATIAIVDDARRPSVRDVPCGGHEIVWQMARQTRMLPDEVRVALLGDEQPDMAPIHASLERACAPLLEDIVTTLRYYAAQNRSTRVNKMLVCGSFASARGFIELLSAKLPIEVVPWNPIADMRLDVDSSCAAMLQKAGSSMAVAAGLAMRTI
jgi:type IV pilus assembly protein PilM